MITDSDRHRLASSFDSAAELYERARPGYCADAVRWALPSEAKRVLDLGAGTGKLTVTLVELGLSVIAIEPSEAMLDELRAALPSVDARIGAAEATGLPDEDVDAVVIGSALHWFERPSADDEIARVLRPNGVVAVLSNRRDTSVAWVAALSELLGALLPDVARPAHSTDLARFNAEMFGPAETAAFAYSQWLDADGLADLVASRSYVISLDNEDRATVLAAVRELATKHPDLAGHETFEMPYFTVVARSRLLSR